jgi:hypothetical protein
MMKAPGYKRLKLNCDEPLSDFAFKFNVRRYTSARAAQFVAIEDQIVVIYAQAGLTLVHFSAQPEPFLTQNTPQHPQNTPTQPKMNPLSYRKRLR